MAKCSICGVELLIRNHRLCNGVCNACNDGSVLLSSQNSPLPMTIEELRSRAIDCAKGKKYDHGKLPYDLLPFSVIDSIVAVQRFGATKYGPNNWQRVKRGKERYIAAALRHISAVQQGSRYDEESGLPHLAHALCSLMYAEWIDQQQLRRHR